MNLKQKIGQLFMVGFDGTEVNAHIENLIKNYNVGNIILFERNCKNPAQILKLTQDLQKLAMKYNGVPLFIGIDQENGMVIRISEGVCAFPGSMAQTNGATEAEVYQVAKYTGEMLEALGINYNLAPSLDINNNPDNPIIGVRSFGEDAQTVSKMGCACIKGLQDAGIIATAKHFPGHGDTAIDSHLSLPYIPHDKERLEKIELYPFKEAIKMGVKSIMTTHIIFPVYEQTHPATLSKNILTELLRNQLGFNGIIITDCMEMKAIDETYTAIKASTMAIEAGADIVCVSHSENIQIACLEETLKQSEQYTLLMDRIEKSCKRILSEKSTINIEEFLNRNISEIEFKLKPKLAIKLAKKISKNSIKIINKDINLPIKNNKVLIIAPDSRGINGADGMWYIPNFGMYAIEKKKNADAIRIETNLSDEIIMEIVTSSKYYDVIIMCLYNSQFAKIQIKLANQLFDTHKKVICIAMRNPYDINLLKNPQTTICTFEYTPLSMDSLLEILF
ncbi:hypothetical protein AN641_04525 [Candidatus Epulonipiscioides gigas]|nr:hypothetical protein AN641_04525 [Epulopiscium sp. SCG-C07WGA-EpuloA2]